VCVCCMGGGGVAWGGVVCESAFACACVHVCVH